MDLSELKGLLKDTTVFTILSDEELQRFADCFELVHYTLGQAVCRAGDEADAFYIVYSGRARVVGQNQQGEEVTVGTLTRGNYFGEQRLLSDSRRHYTVQAAGDLALLRLSKADFDRLLREHPEVREEAAVSTMPVVSPPAFPTAPPPKSRSIVAANVRLGDADFHAGHRGHGMIFRKSKSRWSGSTTCSIFLPVVRGDKLISGGGAYPYDFCEKHENGLDGGQRHLRRVVVGDGRLRTARGKGKRAERCELDG